MVEDRDYLEALDDRENEETRLPDTEAIHLGGLTLVEAFTPSTVGSLRDVLAEWPTKFERETAERLSRLSLSRSGGSGGWQSLGVVRPPGSLLISDGYHDQDLCPGIQAIWLSISYVTPALAMVVATFTLAEEAGELSSLLRQSHRTVNIEPWIRVYGPLGRVRARIPWARPRIYASGHATVPPDEQKRRACLDLIRSHETACSRWFYKRFRGRFALCPAERRPRIRMIFTAQRAPYEQRFASFRAIGLDFAMPLWDGTDPKGWHLTEDRHPMDGDRHVMTLSARRSDVVDNSRSGSKDGSNWYLTQHYGTHYLALASRWAILALLSIYSEGLAALRDNAGRQRRLRRPVRDGQALDDYLVRDGLDAATVVNDLRSMTEDPVLFRWEMPVFTERPPQHPAIEPGQARDFAETLRGAVRQRADRLEADTAATTENIRASTDLRQAIANTKLQRRVMVLTLAAVIIAVVSLLAQSH